MPTVLLLLLLASPASAQPIPSTAPLTWQGDGAQLVVDGIHAFLDGYSRPPGIPSRERLSYILGVTEPRTGKDFETLATQGRVRAVRWQVLDGLHAEGLHLNAGRATSLRLVAIPDADQSPEALAARLANSDAEVLIPLLMDRRDTYSGVPEYRMTNMPHREFLWRILYPLGRHIAGVEVQKVLAAVDWFSLRPHGGPIAVAGYGEGGLIAMYAAALDPRIQTALISGHYLAQRELWREPVYRDVWGLLPDYSDEGLARMIAPRRLLIDTAPGPEVDGPPVETRERRGAAPGGKLQPLAAAAVPVDGWRELLGPVETAKIPDLVDPMRRFERQFQEILAYSRRLIRQSAWVRAQAWTASTPEAMRERLWDDLIGRLPPPSVPANPRTRLLYEEPKFRAYEVVLDVWPRVPAYGWLLVPKDIAPGEKRAAVVTQHGLEGRPRDVADARYLNPTYKQFAVRLAEQGFVTFSPQNPYVLGDRFRQINRKAHPWALSQFSFVTGQHQRILEWLGSLDFIDKDRIGFYGLSYGGFTAMRVPALLPGYALSICSGNFTEWVWKVASLDAPYVYPLTGEYDIPEFNFAHLANHFELATLIFPRPFFVERGHRDGVSWDEWVAYEYAKVYRYYAQKGLRERTGIEYFDGPHEIHGVGTVEFLKRHLGAR